MNVNINGCSSMGEPSREVLALFPLKRSCFQFAVIFVERGFMRRNSSNEFHDLKSGSAGRVCDMDGIGNITFLEGIYNGSLLGSKIFETNASERSTEGACLCIVGMILGKYSEIRSVVCAIAEQRRGYRAQRPRPSY